MRVLTTMAALSLSTACAVHNDTTTPLSLQMARSIISRTEGIYKTTDDSSGPLQAGFVQKAFALAIAQYPNHTLTSTLDAYSTQSSDSLLGIFSNGSSALRYSMDRLSSGNGFVKLFERTGAQKYKQALQALKASVDANPRHLGGGLQYYVYPDWAYLDGMFSFGPFWALYTLTYRPDDTAAWQDLRRQFALLAEHCAFGNSSLLVHGYDASRTAVWANNTLGQSPHVWGRSLGWYVLGLLDVISTIDAHPAAGNSSEAQGVRTAFLHEFQTRMHAIAGIRDTETGAWFQLLDAPGREGNYVESSGSAMFTYALLAGARKQYLTSSHNSAERNNESYVDIGRRAYGYLKETFVVDNGNGTLGWNGTVGVCSLNSTASYEYYTTRPIHYDSVLGSAAFVAASLEAEHLEGEEC